MGCYVKQVDGGDCCQQYITFAADPVTAPDELEVFYRRLAHRLKTENGRVVWEKAFGSLDSREWVERCRQRYLPQKHSNHPFTYLEGAPVGGKGLAGLVLYILRGKEVGYLPRKGCVEYRVDQNRRIYLAPGAAGENRGPSGLAQDFSQSVGRIQKALEQAGMRCSDAVRTWFYLGNIQRDYSLFNTLRREMFDDAGIEYSASSNDLPASTCIEGASPDSTCTMEFLCCDKKTVKLRRIYNPEQNEAEGDQYLHRPTFSRGMLLRTDHFCELQISGTASIDARGKSVYLSDPVRQMEKTLQNVRSLLHAADMDFSDIAESTCFFQHPAHAPYFERCCESMGIAPFAHIKVKGNVCREDLLFELDGIALKATNTAAPSDPSGAKA